MSARSTVAATLAAIAILAALPAAASPQATQQVRPQQRATTGAPPPTGTATLTVTVVTDGGAGVKGARVSAMLVPAGAGAAGAPGQAAVTPMAPAARDGGRGPVLQKQARTGPGGAATLTELPAGTYAFTVIPPPGFVAPVVQERVEVKSGAQATATVKMARGGVVTGRIFDEDGDPVIGATISILRVSRAGGRGLPGGYSSQSTNDLGVYRVWGLAAGDYVIGTHYEDRQMPPTDGTAPADGYIPTFFPGVTAFDAARPVRVTAGQETGGVDIPLIRGRLGTVSGRVAETGGGSAGAGTGGQGGSVQISSRGRNPAFGTRGVPVRPDGTFLIPNVPAGDYYVSAIWGRGGGPNAVREGGFVPVTVNGDEVSVTIQTNTGATVSGRLVLEGTPPAQAGAPGSPGRQGQLRVMTRPTSEQYAAGFSAGEQSPTSGAVRPDGTFTLSGLRGPLQFTATGGRAALKEIRRGATDISGQPVELLGTERIDDLVVVMTYDTGGIQGVIEDDGDKPISDAAALIVPDDPDKWNAGSPFVRTARVSPSSPGGTPFTAATPGVTTTTPAPSSDTGASGFQLAQLPPGRYLVVAFADGGMPYLPDRATVERLRESGTTVTVEAGQTATVKVKAIR